MYHVNDAMRGPALVYDDIEKEDERAMKTGMLLVVINGLYLHAMWDF